MPVSSSLLSIYVCRASPSVLLRPVLLFSPFLLTYMYALVH
jgi:hypothetical protein